jgi:hypothetical protein
MTLETLFARSGICAYYQRLWFSHATLVQSSLLVSDKDDFSYISRCYGDRLHAVWPGIDIKFAPASAPPKPIKSVFKKQAYRGRDESSGDQGDLY